MKIYHLEYIMNIGNGPQAGEYPQTGGFTTSEAKKDAWLAEHPSHTATRIGINAITEHHLDADEREAFRNAAATQDAFEAMQS